MSNQPITIVSGLPRSGTSLLMQMINAGGVAALTDQVRATDEDNPRGYFELEAVKRTNKDASWLADAEGHVVKLVHLLLYNLPADRRYQVVFMKRNLREVIRSQSLMLERRGTEGANLSDDQLVKAYESQLERVESWLGGQTNFRVLYVNYNRLMEEPAEAASEVNRFLGGGLDEEAMVRHVDPSLYRQRA